MSDKTSRLLKHDGYVIGFVVIDNSDAFHVAGTFSPGPDYAKYEDLFEQLMLSGDLTEGHGDSDAYRRWEDAFDETNGLGLVLEDPSDGGVEPIWDFRFIGQGYVEFKFDIPEHSLTE